MNGLTALALVLAGAGPVPDGVILEFSATWCGPCQSIAPTVHRLEQQGLPIRSVDYDAEPALVKRFRIDRVPAFVVLVRGEEVKRHVGPLDENGIRRLMNLIPARPAFVEEPAPQPAPQAPGPEVRLVSTRDVSSRDVAAADPRMSILPGGGRAALTGGARDLISVSTRIRVKDRKGMDIGSGTLIHSEPGRSLVLTCGHIFRHFDETGRIEVDVFSGETFQTCDGTLISHDLDQDIGLISIPTQRILPVAPVATLPVTQGDITFSVGCGGGTAPTRLQHRVSSTTKYQGDFVECTGAPVQGRSGGGLFTLTGEVAGVCVLADNESSRGLYAGLKTIHGLLQRASVAPLLLPSGTSDPSPASADAILANANPGAEPVALDPEDPGFGSRFEEPSALMESAAPRLSVAANSPMFDDDPIGSGPLADHEDAEAIAAAESLPFEHRQATALPTDEFNHPADRSGESAAGTGFNDELALAGDLVGLPIVAMDLNGSTAPAADSGAEPRPLVRGASADAVAAALDAAPGAEVVCVIRDRSSPQSSSRVVIIHRATQQFVADLTGELNNQIQPTSLRTAPTKADHSMPRMQQAGESSPSGPTTSTARNGQARAASIQRYRRSQ